MALVYGSVDPRQRPQFRVERDRAALGEPGFEEGLAVMLAITRLLVVQGREVVFGGEGGVARPDLPGMAGRRRGSAQLRVGGREEGVMTSPAA